MSIYFVITNDLYSHDISGKINIISTFFLFFYSDFISHRSLLYPILLSEGIYSTLFVLYANKCSQRDELYRQRVTICDKKTDLELLAMLKINRYFNESHLYLHFLNVSYKFSSIFLPVLQHTEFESAIASLRQVKEKFCPREMLKLIEITFKHVEKSAEAVSNLPNAENAVGSIDNVASEPILTREITKYTPAIVLNADNMMPLSIFLLLRAAIPHLGTEIFLLEDLMGNDFEYLMNGYAGYCFTTVKAAFQHIINESFV